MEDRDALTALEARVHNAGFYPYRLQSDEFAVYSSSPEYRDQIFQKVVTETVHGWIELAETKLKGTGRRIIVTAGNDDPLFLDDLFTHSPVITFAERQVIMLDENHEMLNEGFSNPTPWHTHRELDEDSLYAEIKQLTERLKDPSNAVFNIHVPPYGSRLDDAPKLDDQLRPVDGGQNIIPVGSTAVRKIIEQCQPVLGLHGHIHEAKGAAKIGRTLCINPGSSYGEGVLSGVLVTLTKKGVMDYQPVQG